MQPSFIHLRCFSSYSLSESALKINDIISLCKKNKMPSVAITDNKNLFGSLEFCSYAANNGIQPIVGCTIHIKYKDIIAEIALIAQNELGYKNLLKHVSRSFTVHDSTNPFVPFEEIIANNEGLILLSGGDGGILNEYIQINKQIAEEIIILFQDAFKDRFYIELQRTGIDKEEDTNDILIEFAYNFNIPLVATNKVKFSDKEMFEAHDILLCIAQGAYQYTEDRTKSNIEYYFKSPEEMKLLFEDVPEAIENTINIAKRCHFMCEPKSPMLPSAGTDAEEEKNILIQLATSTLEKKITHLEPAQKDIYYDRLKYELDVINKMNFAGYFLIVSDFINWSKSNSLPVGPGRGSGAGSVVAWCLNITDLDPIRFGLVFERFLNPERISMPDFDIDFCQERRDEVIKYVQQKYGEKRVAQIITFGKLQARAVIKDVGRVMQLPYPVVDRISKLVPFNAVNPVSLAEAIEIEPLLKEAGEKDSQIQKLLEIALKLEGLNRHASTHAAGIVIADRDLEELVPLYADPRSDMLVIQYSMKYAEMAGLVKFDFLGLKTLTVIANTVKLITQDQIDPNTIALDDKKTYEMLSKGQSTGVFQFESAGMKDSLRKLRPDKIEDLMALGALYRPGPMDNIPIYIACKHGQKSPDYMHQDLEVVLKETFGVIIYQEQVLKIAQIFAGYSLGKADLLRRAMGKKIKEEMDDQRQLFVQGAIEQGREKNQAIKLFDLVAKFAGYGFNRAHAACYAIISYQTAFLKANYPLEFLTASLNLEINDTDKINIFIQECKLLNIEVLLPDINKSQSLFSIENGKIRYGLGALKNVGVNAVETIIEERILNGEFKSIFDLCERLDNKIFNKRQLESLIKSGSLDSISSYNRNSLLESVDLLLNYNTISAEEKSSNQISLFSFANKNICQRPKLKEVKDWSKTEKLNHELEAFGFYLSDHPLSLYKELLQARNYKDSLYIKDLLPQGNHSLKLAGVILSSKARISPKGRYMSLLLSDQYGNFEVTIFDGNLLEKAANFLEESIPISLRAEVRKDEGGVRMTVIDIAPLTEVVKENLSRVSISLVSSSYIEELKAYLANLQQGATEVLIKMKLEGKHIEILLGNKFSISPLIREEMENINGVEYIVTE